MTGVREVVALAAGLVLLAGIARPGSAGEIRELGVWASEWNGTIRLVDAGGTRRLYTGEGGRWFLQSTIDLEHPTRLVERYTQVLSLATALHPSPEAVLSIGLGGGVLPRFHLARHATSRVVSVDLDPAIVEVARQWLAVDDPRHEIRVADGAVVVGEARARYDVVWLDAFSPRTGVPEPLTTAAFVAAVRASLRPQGLFVANLWDADPSRFDALATRFARSFASALRLGIPGAKNVILAATDRPGLDCEAYRVVVELWTRGGEIDPVDADAAVSTCAELP